MLEYRSRAIPSSLIHSSPDRWPSLLGVVLLCGVYHRHFLAARQKGETSFPLSWAGPAIRWLCEANSRGPLGLQEGKRG